MLGERALLYLGPLHLFYLQSPVIEAWRATNLVWYSIFLLFLFLLKSWMGKLVSLENPEEYAVERGLIFVKDK